MKLIDLSGRRYGMLVVVGRAESTGHHTMWKTRCECGTESRASSSNLTKGKARSCGCNRWKRGSEHHDWKGHGRISAQKWGLIVRRHLYRESRTLHDFNITIEYAWELYEKQEGRCALTGLPIDFGDRISDPSTASLDRIDAKVGYVVGNVQWVHKDINRMKNVFGQDYFIEMCRRVAEHAGEKK